MWVGFIEKMTFERMIEGSEVVVCGYLGEEPFKQREQPVETP